jgi:hypothetical protein
MGGICLGIFHFCSCVNFDNHSRVHSFYEEGTWVLNMNQNQRIGLRLSDSMRQSLERIALREQRSLSNIIKVMIDESIKRRLNAAWEKRNGL